MIEPGTSKGLTALVTGATVAPRFGVSRRAAKVRLGEFGNIEDTSG